MIMDALAEKQIRESFVNCTKGEAKRLPLPRGMDGLPWDDLDFLGWRDQGAPDRAYLVAEHRGRLTGVMLRVPPATRKSMAKHTVCSICLTSHAGSGVSLLTARRAGPAGRQGNTIGTYLCADLACPLYVRGKKQSLTTSRFEESLTVPEQLARMLANLGGFLDQVTEEAAAG
jgi:hypothetical protein